METIHTSSYPISAPNTVYSSASDTPTESIIDAVIANRHRLVEVGIPLGDVDVTVIPATPTSPEVTVTVARHQKHKALVTATGLAVSPSCQEGGWLYSAVMEVDSRDG